MTLPDSAAGIAEAAQLLRAGHQVAFPTETVYGLGADATNAQAVTGIYAAKGRPAFNPLIVHVADVAQARALVLWSDRAEALANAFWPGPLTLVLPQVADAPIADLVTAGLATLAIRVPAAPLAQALIRATGKPLAAPSANPSGRISSVTAEQVRAGLDGRIAAILDGGPCAVGLESSIVAPGQSGAEPPRLLRPGGVAADALAEVLGVALEGSGTGITAPGQTASHYAPDQKVRLNATQSRVGEFLIGFGAVPGDVSLSLSGDVTEAAANLFTALHRADTSGKPIAVAPVPNQGLGVAINDRLRRAAAPRNQDGTGR